MGGSSTGRKGSVCAGSSRVDPNPLVITEVRKSDLSVVQQSGTILVDVRQPDECHRQGMADHLGAAYCPPGDDPGS